MLLKVVLFAYSQGIVSSRGIERACREHITFIALSGDSAPHYSTLAAFVTGLGDAIAKLEAAAQHMLARARANDTLPSEPGRDEKAQRRIARLQGDASQLRDWLAAHPEDRKGAKGSIRKSNHTDNQSVKMATSKGVIQGYTGVAAADDRHQIIVEAQAHGTGSEQELLLPVIQATESLRTDQTLVTADAGYHSEANIAALAEQQLPALVAGTGMRMRDERFKDQDKYKALPAPLYDEAHPKKGAKHYRPKDFNCNPAAGTCHCPAGKQLYQNGANCNHKGLIGTKFQGVLRDCVPCELREKSLRMPEQTKARQVMFFRGMANSTLSASDRMKQAIDLERGRQLYGRRFATVEPVFGNLRHNKRLNRFTLRGRQKADG
jgi:hypothetical protein